MEPLRLSSPPPFADYLCEPAWPSAVDACRSYLASLPEEGTVDGATDGATRYLRWLTTEVEGLLEELRRRGLPIDDPSTVADPPAAELRPGRGPEDYVAYVVWIDYEDVRLPPAGDDADLTDPPHYSISVQASADVDPPFFDGPDFEDLGEAVQWARARASRVLVRPSWDPGRHYVANDGPRADWPPFG